MYAPTPLLLPGLVTTSRCGRHKQTLCSEAMLAQKGGVRSRPQRTAQAMRAGRARMDIMHAATAAAAAPEDPQLHHPTGPAARGLTLSLPAVLPPHSSPRSWKAGAGSAAEGSCTWPGVVGPCSRAGSRATGEWLQAPISAPSLPRLVSC